MREIKFRGYDTEFKKITYFDDEEYDYRPPLSFRLDQVFKKDSNYNDYEDFEYKDITDKLVIMQYTGLKDKNRNEIYEGDIVKALINGIWYIGQVIYEHSGFTIDITNNKQLKFGRRGIIEIFTEVIGNIYENKNLLEEKEQC